MPEPTSGCVSPAERIARAFHERYELLAPNFEYETRRDSAVAWEDVPEKNRRLMLTVVASLIADGVIAPARVLPTTEEEL